MRYFAYLALLILISSCEKYGKKLSYGKNEAFYTENVTKEQAQKLGDYLQSSHFFSDERSISVQLDKSVDTFLFRFVVVGNYVNEPDYIEKGKIFSTELSQNVFNNKPTIIHFCDDHFKTVRVVRP